MPGFYRLLSETDEISQGDIFNSVPIFSIAHDSLHQVIPGSDGQLASSKVSLDELTSGMTILAPITMTKSIVISQSCDAARGTRIMMAPIREFMFGKNDHRDEPADEKKWPIVSKLATSLSEPKVFYLPDNSNISISRHTVEFDEAFSIPRKYLQALAKQKGARICGLGSNAVLYLQFRIAAMLARMAQDDYAWPSQHDLRCKIAHYEKKIGTLKKKCDELAQGAATKPEVRVEYEEECELLNWLENDLKKAKASLDTADNLA